ncbi:MAG: hypothetical protein ACI8RD_011086 [Bacillariaceae sp.]|jgi:hypothetical protein
MRFRIKLTLSAIITICPRTAYYIIIVIEHHNEIQDNSFCQTAFVSSHLLHSLTNRERNQTRYNFLQ